MSGHEITGAWVDELEMAGRTWTFATCLKCRQLAPVSPAGQVFCETCSNREIELQRLLASVAQPVVYGSLRSALLGSTGHSTPRLAAW